MSTSNQHNNPQKPEKRVVRMAPRQDSKASHTHMESTKNSISGKKKKSKKDKKPMSNGARAGKAMAMNFGKLILTVFLILVITVCVVGTALTVFVMKYVDSESDYDLNNIQTTYTSNVYGLNESGEETLVQTISSGGRRVWVDQSDVPEHVKDAIICAEDKDFKEHEGVNWMRTIAAFVNMASGDRLNFNSGASTISQQLIKNINGDYYERTPAKKVKEILGALNLERNYSKDEILGAYMNYITLGRGNYGIQAGAEYYFGKDVQELTLVEAASLASITQSPSNNNPIDNPERNKERRNYVLKTMLEEEKITQQEYDEAVSAELVVTGYVPEGSEETPLGNQQGNLNGIYNWYVDAAIFDVQEALVEQGYCKTPEEALAKINGGGLQIYTAMDIAMQEELERQFLDDNNFSSFTIENHPDAAMVIMDYNGYVKAQVGSRKQKEVSLAFSNAYQGCRPVGSTMKPITTYGLALNSDLITWSDIRVDEAKTVVNGKPYPNNWNDKMVGNITIIDALKFSKNTIPVELLLQLGADKCANWLHDNLGMESIPADAGPALTLGSYSVYLNQLAAAYQIFGNGGYYSPCKTYTRVEDAAGKVILEADTSREQVIDSDTSFIMNKMLEQVIVGSGGTGYGAKLPNMTVVGKTGTNEATDLSFVGMTPYYVSALWIGYKDGNVEFANSSRNYGYEPKIAWKNIMTPIMAGYENKEFDIDGSNVVQKSYCKETGLIASSSCPNQDVGYYKKTKIPSTCRKDHGAADTSEGAAE